jgi:hypothetical protein
MEERERDRESESENETARSRHRSKRSLEAAREGLKRAAEKSGKQSSLEVFAVIKIAEERHFEVAQTGREDLEGVDGDVGRRNWQRDQASVRLLHATR